MRPIALLLAASLLACASDPAPAPDAALPCGGACGAGTVCSAGRCVASGEDAGLDAPADAAPDGGACPVGFRVCVAGGACIDLRSTLEHCGACGAPCFAWGRGMDGRCTRADVDAGFCPAGRRDCNQAEGDECEVDITTSDTNCGACGRACAARERCTAGACVPR